MLQRFVLFALALMFCATHAAATEADAVFARYKEASGAAHWDAINSQKSTGTLAVGGLSGDFEAITDTRIGAHRITTSSVRSKARRGSMAASAGHATPAVK